MLLERARALLIPKFIDPSTRPYPNFPTFMASSPSSNPTPPPSIPPKSNHNLPVHQSSTFTTISSVSLLILIFILGVLLGSFLSSDPFFRFFAPPAPIVASDPIFPGVTHLYTLYAECLHTIYKTQGPKGIRQAIPIVGGNFTGPRVSGTLPFSSRFVLIVPAIAQATEHYARCAISRQPTFSPS